MLAMARNFPNQQLDLVQILQEAQQRWLRPSEICEIIRNYHKFQLTPDPPVKPAAGSLFLFNRKALRYFRKDGHRWRKKKDGKTVREAHEKLKASSVDVLHCYYAHGEDDENFQRRSYWMLDGQLEHIVLVHYREVKVGYKSGISRAQNADPTESPQESSARFFIQGNSSLPTVQNSHGSSPNTVDFSGQTLSTEFDDGDSGDYPVATSSLTQPLFGYAGCNISLPGLVRTGPLEVTKNHLGSEFSGTSFNNCTESLLWGNNSSTNVLGAGDQKYHFEQPSGSELMTHMLIDLKPGANNVLPTHFGDRMTSNVDKGGAYKPNSERGQQEQNFNLDQPQLQRSYHPQTIVSSTDIVNNNYLRSNNVESVELKKLDSFGRWMDKEIGKDCDDSLMASDSGNYWNTLNEQNDDKEVSSLSGQMQLDIGSPSPSLAQEQLFSIKDFSPDSTNCGVETKVLITGKFLGDAKSYNQYNWSCMFGEIEVSAEVLTESAIRCRAPLHASGCVPFYITCSNRLACSEVREFEYREDPSGVAFNMSVRSAPEEEMHFQISLTKLLCSSFERMWLDCSIQDCDKCKLKNKIYLMKSGHETDWASIEKDSSVLGGNYNKVKDVLIQNLLKDKLCEWLVCKTHEGGKGPNILDEQGQGVIHLAAALGYDWAMAPIVAAGVSPSFRDSRGRTGLHWASYYGREATVTALVRLGAAPGALEDPTPAFPGGKTAADLASSRGYKGIAGYLAEADLVSHLSSMSINRNEIDSFTANIAADKATETAIQTAIPSDKEQCSLKRSLTAVRNSTRAAALIQSALRAISFRHRQSIGVVNDNVSEDPHDLVALGSLSRVQKVGHFHDYLHSAAIKIQQKYRGWKGRKDFLKIRSRIVKLQAHVRGHQVRKQYKKVIWSVSIVEKAVLRWRRKRPGLRGFRGTLTTDKEVSEAEKSDDYDFLRIGRKQKFAGVEKALARVQSMVRHPEARDQYMRMVTNFENFKMGDEGSNGRHD